MNEWMNEWMSFIILSCKNVTFWNDNNGIGLRQIILDKVKCARWIR